MKTKNLILITLIFVLMFVMTTVVFATSAHVHTFTAATCTKAKTCTICGATSGSALGHNPQVIMNTQATCSTSGRTIVQCTKCGINLTDKETGALGHTYTAATCTKPKTCTICGATSGSALGHNFTAATCTEVATCTRCGATSGEVLGHNYIAATCTKPKTCTRCGATSGQALGHDFTGASCTEVATCRRCGATSGTALGHNFSAATCTKPKTCTRCGVTSGQALGHDEEVISTGATCTIGGSIRRVCKRCGETLGVGTSGPLGHNYSEYRYSTEEHWKICLRCGIESYKGTHTFNSKNICTVCGYSKGSDIVDEYDKLVKVKYNGSTLSEKTRVTVEAGDEITILATPSTNVEKLYYVLDDEDEVTVRASSTDVTVPNYDEGTYFTLAVCALYDDNEVTDWQYYYFKIADDGEEEEDDDDELIIEPWMKENDDLNSVAVSLRNDSDEYEKANRNMYELNEEVVYYVDYKNGGKKTTSAVTLILNVPEKFKVIDADGGTVSTSKKTITWKFNGLDKDESGTKIVKLKYTSIGTSKVTYKMVKPIADIKVGTKIVDSSGVINLIFKDVDTEIEETHFPYMYGDKDAPTFRPDDTITRAEGALVLTRIFGISTAYDRNDYNYPDLNETYEEARTAIVAATGYGIINGYADGYYRPNQPMTRAEFMKIIAARIEIENEDDRGFEIKDSDDAIKLYKDPTRYYVVGKDLVSEHWALEEVTLLARLNMTSAADDKNLRLDDYITRAEVAQLVNYYLFRAPSKVTGKTTTNFTDVNRNHKLYGDILEATRDSHDYTITEKGMEIAK